MLVLLYALLGLSLVLVVALNVYSAAALLWLRTAARRRSEPAGLCEWPQMTLLVAAYREERCLRECIRSISATDYPHHRLQVLIITEAHDLPTSGLARQLAMGAPEGIAIENVVVSGTEGPPGKPRALNQGLRRATGAVIGVIDAEDIVDPQLCKVAAYALATRGLDVVQGVLDMANDYDGWLNLLFRAEYGYWFRLYLPSAAAAGYPLPLGGTTNFFTRAALEKLGGWDAYNLTEDFDAGVRAYEASLRVGTIDCVTREESPTTLAAWLRQRTRWQRGKLQTLLRVLRTPRFGVPKRAHALMTCLAPHVVVFNLASIIVSVYVLQFHGVLPPAYWDCALFVFLWTAGLCVLHSFGYLVATREEGVQHRVLKAVVCGATVPLYWLAQWLAECRALRQEFLERTLFWEKTEHFLRHLPAAAGGAPERWETGTIKP